MAVCLSIIFDVYRIGDIEEMEEIGYDDYFYGNGICLIEWANLIEEILPEDRIQITIEKDLEKGFDYRKITVTGLPKRFCPKVGLTRRKNENFRSGQFRNRRFCGNCGG